MDEFHQSQEFLTAAKAKANAKGYNPNALYLDTGPTYKLVYKDGTRTVRFGRKGYGDHIYYSKFEPEIAEQKRNTFRKSHGAISRIYGLGKFSANEMALKILW
jgi:hypothetical protein